MVYKPNENAPIDSNIRIIKKNIITGKEVLKQYKNLITNVAFHNIIYALIDDVSFVDGIDYLALGDDNTTALVTDTALGNETFRKIYTDRYRTGQIVYFEFFLDTTDANDTHFEIGLYGNGAGAGSGSGELFNHCIISGGEEKLNTETWTIQVYWILANKA